MSPAPRDRRTKEHLHVEDLKLRLEEAEETLRAIRRGDVDGIVVEGHRGKQVYTLRGADESYRTLVEAMNEGALVLDPKGVILHANRRFAELVKTTLRAVMGRPAAEFVPDEHHPTYRTLISKSNTAPASQELELQASDGARVPVQLSANSVHIEDQRGICLLVTDLTEQKRREMARVQERRLASQEIRRHASDLERINAELEAFVYSVSHDLRTPLRSIHRYGTLIRDEHGAQIDDTAKDYLDRITGAAEHMDELIRDLLVYSRVSRQEVALEPVDTSAVVASVINLLSDDISRVGGEVTVHEPLPRVTGDSVLVSQIVTNLVTNALKFVGPGVRPRVRLRSESRAPAVRLWVEDNGIGIPKDAQSRIFRVFERHSVTYAGTGIGLAIVKRAVERMGGAVGVESEEGHGSRFWVDLPGEGARR